jgi:hypothetical protein
LARLNANGTFDTTFDGDGYRVLDWAGGTDVLRDMLVLPDGDIVAVGETQDAGGATVARIKKGTRMKKGTVTNRLVTVPFFIPARSGRAEHAGIISHRLNDSLGG